MVAVTNGSAADSCGRSPTLSELRAHRHPRPTQSAEEERLPKSPRFLDESEADQLRVARGRLRRRVDMTLSTNMSSSQPTGLGTDTLAVNALGPRLVLTIFVGKAAWTVGENARRQFEALIAMMEEPVWISDAS